MLVRMRAAAFAAAAPTYGSRALATAKSLFAGWVGNKAVQLRHCIRAVEPIGSVHDAQTVGLASETIQPLGIDD